MHARSVFAREGIMMMKRILAIFCLTALVFQVRSLCSMSFTTLGTGTCIPLPSRSCPANLLQYKGKNIMVDCGGGALALLAKLGLSVCDLDAIFITHFHVDHISDLPMILQSRVVHEFDACDQKLPLPGRLLTIYGPKGLLDHIKSFEKIYGCLVCPKTCTYRELEPGQIVTSADMMIAPHKVTHTQESMGYSFTAEGKKIVVSGDSAADNILTHLLQDADLAVVECSYSDEFAALVPFVHHLSPLKIALIAKLAGVKHVVATHLYPSADQVDVANIIRSVFDGAVTVASDGQTFSL